MKSVSKNPTEKKNEQARYYVIFNELAKASEENAGLDIPAAETNEIEQIMQAIVDVSDEPPQFVTST
jgi:hypothetical protein